MQSKSGVIEGCMDGNGVLLIPQPMMEELQLVDHSPVLLCLRGSQIIITNATSSCVKCGAPDRLIENDGTFLCSRCYRGFQKDFADKQGRLIWQEGNPRNQKIFEDIIQGHTYAAVAENYHLSAQSIRLIFQEYLLNLIKDKYPLLSHLEQRDELKRFEKLKERIYFAEALYRGEIVVTQEQSRLFQKVIDGERTGDLARAFHMTRKEVIDCFDRVSWCHKQHTYQEKLRASGQVEHPFLSIRFLFPKGLSTIEL